VLLLGGPSAAARGAAGTVVSVLLLSVYESGIESWTHTSRGGEVLVAERQRGGVGDGESIVAGDGGAACGDVGPRERGEIVAGAPTARRSGASEMANTNNDAERRFSNE
jgi:hypothetical protein